MSMKRVLMSTMGWTVLVGLALAQSGPELPCVNCPEWSGLNDWRSLPESGIWRNPEQSGTGFMLEVQGERLAGYYYVYTEAGDPTWLLFSGVLERSGEADVAWTLEAELERFEDGACLNCAYRPPVLGESPGTIHFEFLHRGYGRFRVDDEPAQNILPLTYGISGSRIFQPYSELVVPRLEGPVNPVDGIGSLSSHWLMVFEALPSGVIAGLGDVHVRRIDQVQHVDVPEQVVRRYRVTRIVGYPGMPDQINTLGTLDCEVAADHGPICRLDFDSPSVTGALAGKTFWIRPGDITDARFFGEDEEGWTVEAHRMYHD